MIQVFCGISGLINFLTCLSLAAFVYFKNRSGKINKVFALWSASVAFWSFGYFMWLFTKEYEQALFWTRFLMTGSIWIPSTFFHFALVYLGLQDRHRRLIWLCYGLSAISFASNFTPLFVRTIEPRGGFRWWPLPGVMFHFFMVYFLATITYTHYLFFQRVRRETSEVARKQLKMVAYGTFLAYLGGSTNFFLWYNIPIPPVLNLLVTCYVGFIAYAILYYRLWDLDFIIRKTIVFTGIVGSFVFIFLSLTYFFNLLISRYVGAAEFKNLAAILAFALGVLLYRPAERFLIHLTDRFLFQKKFDYQKLLRDASAGISKIKSLNHLMSLVVHFVTMRVRVKKAAVLMYDGSEKLFRFCYPRGYGRNHRLQSGITLNQHDPLIEYLARVHMPIDLEQVNAYAKAGNGPHKKGDGSATDDFNAIRMRMEELETTCCVPSFLGTELRNVLLLGEKKSGDYYTEQDLNMLYTLAQESAIAIENARLYDQAIEKAKELEGINHELNTAQNQLLSALSETEVANKKLRNTHAQLIHEQKMATLGRLASSVGHEVNNPLTILSMNVSRAILKYRRNPDLKMADVLDVFQKMEQNISRIKAVVNTLTGLLKKSEHGKFEPLSLKLVLEETLPLVQFQTYLENLSGTEVEFDISGHIPLIKGDLERLQEVFLNLFINAYHAMMGKRRRKILVTASETLSKPPMITIEFSDNGAGMTDDVMKKIFTYGYTTKPAGKGSGMGLYMCRYIIEMHGGEIKVRSRAGEGTTFVITLPAYREGDETLSTSSPEGTTQS